MIRLTIIDQRISLTCIICKIMESRDKIVDHFVINKLFKLTNRQFGFLKGRSLLSYSRF